MDIKRDDIDEIINKVLQLGEDIENSKLTFSDSNVLSVAMGKLEDDVNKMNAAARMANENNYKDMVDYYDNGVQIRYDNLVRNYNIVLKLLSVAKDKERESLLMYLE